MKFRIVVLITLFSISVPADKVLENSHDCNQKIYDAIYLKILDEAIKSDISREALEKRNDTIEILRGLCNGQLSTYETVNLHWGFK